MTLIDPAGDDLKAVAAAIAFNNRQLRGKLIRRPVDALPGSPYGLPPG